MASKTSTWRSPDDQDFLDVKMRDLKRFRDSIFPKEFIESHPTIFLYSEWVDILKLKAFLAGISSDEDVLAKLMVGKAISEDLGLDTPPCSHVVPPHIGGKLKQCSHPHIMNGTTLVDVRAILPEGSKRVKVKSVRAWKTWL
ncbi:hypothetical protein H0H87_008082 [Tephrocybe sp. NHM501043]|nr:hypothetical protein H0H87_008082 [Tephrocybe sp. NHM501043]